MKIHTELQGSQEWLALRASRLCASEAPAMMGVSKYTTRSELLRQKATGNVPEVDAAKQALFDRGHSAEENARPLVVGQIGEELFPITGALEVDGLPLLASFDGLNMAGDTAWEHKLFSNGLAAAIERKEIEPHYWAQLEQQLLVSGANRVFFTTGTTDGNNLVGMWYESVPERRQQLIAGWKQFKTDLDAYQHVPSAPDAVAEHIDNLPALAVQIEGRVLQTNLDAFSQTARTFIAKINTDLKTDDDFATAEKTAKFCKDAEARLAMVKEQAISQMATVDEVFRLIDGLSEELRGKRLTLEKAVKTRKDDIRVEIQNEAKAALVAHIGELNQIIGRPYMPVIAADFAGVMRGKKTVTSLRDAVSTELARCKIEADEMSRRIMMNLNSLRELAAEHTFLFADTAQIVLKANDDLVALIKTRIAEHKEVEAKRVEQARIKVEANAALAKAVEDTVVVGDITGNVGALRITPGKVEVIPAKDIYIEPVAAQATTARPPDDQMAHAVGAMLGDVMVHMHITNITRRAAVLIAELLGNGSVVWQNGSCYPTSQSCCTIVLAGKHAQ